MPKDTPLFKAAKKELKRLPDEFTSCPFYYSVIANDGEVYYFGPQYCYSALWDSKIVNNKYFIDNSISQAAKDYQGNRGYEENVPDVDTKRYIKWWVQASFCAAAFVTKDPLYILKNGAILSCDYPASYVITAAIGLRYIVEYPAIVKRWCKLSEYINPDAAIFAAHCFMEKANGYIGFIRADNHTWYQNEIGKEGFNKAIKHQLRLDGEKMAQDTHFSPLSRIYDVNYERYEELSKPKSTRHEIKNSFGKVVRTVDGFYPSETMEIWLKEFVTLNTETE